MYTDSCKIDNCGNMRYNDEDESYTINSNSDGEYDDSDVYFYLIYVIDYICASALHSETKSFRLESGC